MFTASIMTSYRSSLIKRESTKYMSVIGLLITLILMLI